MIKKLVITPFQRFVRTESLSGILLFAATLIAIIWVNSPYVDGYNSIWQYEIGFSFQKFTLNKPIILWINDGLMAIFFFLIGLELKREFLIGELDSVKKAVFPLFAAIGGVVVPIIIYFILNNNEEATKGWGIPMATDIAFALAILKLLGNRVPLSIKVFLTAFAIIDDIAAVLVIAIFYSESIDWMLLVYGFMFIGFIGVLSYKKIYSSYLYFIIGVIIWVIFLKSGIHPTIAGILMAFTIPIRQKINIKEYVNRVSTVVTDIKEDGNTSNDILSKRQIALIENLESYTEKVRSPLQDLEYNLHHLVAYLIMPIFALANAGISINGSIAPDYRLGVVIILSMFFGKMTGISLFSYIGIKAKVIELPRGVKFNQIIGVSILAGVGFTMSIFIANLAFGGMESYIDSAKIGILAGSFVSGLLGYFVLRFAGKSRISR